MPTPLLLNLKVILRIQQNSIVRLTIPFFKVPQAYIFSVYLGFCYFYVVLRKCIISIVALLVCYWRYVGSDCDLNLLFT